MEEDRGKSYNNNLTKTLPSSNTSTAASKNMLKNQAYTKTKHVRTLRLSKVQSLTDT